MRWQRPLVIILALLGAIFIGYQLRDLWSDGRTDFAKNNWKLVLGIASAAITGFLVLGCFQQGEKLGTVNFPGGVEFSGVVGEVVLWLLVFISVIWAFHILAA